MLQIVYMRRMFSSEVSVYIQTTVVLYDIQMNVQLTEALALYRATKPNY